MTSTGQSERNAGVSEDPYHPKISYKDALLAEVADASNKLGVDTFKLMHRIYKDEGKETPIQGTTQADEGSILSDDTSAKQNRTIWHTCRMRFQITLPDTTAETYMEDLTGHINRVLEVMNLNTPGVRLAPWHKTAPSPDEFLSELSEDPMDAIRYLYGFKAGTGRAGPQYFRINLAIPSTFTPDDVVKRNKNSLMIPGQQSLLLANSQSINPTTIGWLLRSNPTMVDFPELEKILRALWTVKGGFGLYWAVVRDGDKYDPATSARAIHIETEEEYAPRLISLAEKTYGGRFSNTVEDYPLGISLMFVRPFNSVPAKVSGTVKKLAAYQKTNDMMLTSYSWLGEIALDRSIKEEGFESLRHWLMSLTSIHEKPKKDGTTYKDKLFTSIHRSPNKLETRFYFYQSNKHEALNVISGLPLMVATELELDPGCFFRQADYVGIMDGKWNAKTREYKHKQVINQDQYLEELDDFFLANSEYLPEVIIMDKGGRSSIANDAAKVMAMANGEDEVSVLSQLTDKTLKEANLCPRPGTSSSTSSVTSIQSGNTSKSKTQAAVKEALKEVSLEHNKAMMEQKQLFQKEIEALQKALNTHTAMSPRTDGNRSNTAPEGQNPMHSNDNQGLDEDGKRNRSHASINTTDGGQSTEGVLSTSSIVQVDDSSDDEASLQPTPRAGRRRGEKPSKSPIHKRPKRSKYRSTRAQGGPSSSSQNINE